jgi:hypothetical protein
MICRSKIQRHKGQPNDTGCVHGESWWNTQKKLQFAESGHHPNPPEKNILTYMLGLVKRFGNFTRQHRINGAHHNQQDWVGERNHVGGVHVRIAHQQVVFARRIVVDGVRRCNYHPHRVD